MLEKTRHFSSPIYTLSPNVAPNSTFSLSDCSIPHTLVRDLNHTPNYTSTITSSLQNPSLLIHNFNLGNEKPLTVTAFLNYNIEAITMIDSGASTSFIDDSFAKKNKITSRKKNLPETVRVVCRWTRIFIRSYHA